MVHLFKNNGYNIILDVNSGLIHSVDELTYDIVECFTDMLEKDGIPEGMEEAEYFGSCKACIASCIMKKQLEESLYKDESGSILSQDMLSEEIGSCFTELEELVSGRELFTKDIYQSYIADMPEKKPIVKALCLHIAHDCNLACRYCFAEEGEYHGRRALMSFETGKAALDFLIQNSGNRKNLEVDFFGGEPLMNFDVVEQLVSYGREQEKKYDKQFRFTLTTNGILLNDKVMEFANRELANIVLSIDGRKEVNDKMRPFRNGTGSYDYIVPKYQVLAESRGQQKYYVRGTFTHDNLDFAEDVKHLFELGFEQISIEPVVGGPEESYSIKEEDIPAVKDEYDKLAAYILKQRAEGRSINFFHFMIDLSGGPCAAKRISGCGSGTEYLAVTPWGDFYPCHQFVGLEEYLMGNVNEGIVRQDIRKDFLGCHMYAKEKCRKCFARFFCGGGCAANAYIYDGSILGAYDIGCELERKRVECAIMIKAAEAAGADKP